MTGSTTKIDTITTDAAAVAAILQLLRARTPSGSISLIDAARLMAETELQSGSETWRRFLPIIRRTARHLAESGVIDILRKGRAVEPGAAKGVVRLRLHQKTPDQNPEHDNGGD